MPAGPATRGKADGPSDLSRPQKPQDKGISSSSCLEPNHAGRNPHCEKSGPPSALKLVKGTMLTSTRSEEHTSELQSLMRISYAVFCLKKKNVTLQLQSTAQ